MFQKHDSFGQDEYEELAEYCHQVGIEFVSTPFDDEAIEFLDPLVPFFKDRFCRFEQYSFLRKIISRVGRAVYPQFASKLGEIDTALKHSPTAVVQMLFYCIAFLTTDNDN